MTRNKMKKIIGQNLRAARRNLKVSQVELAEYIGISQANTSKVESGEASLSVEEMLLAAKKLKISAIEIFRGVEV